MYFIDSSRLYNYKSISNSDIEWSFNENEQLNFAPSKSVYWVKFTVQNQSADDKLLYLQLAYAHIANYQMFVHKNDTWQIYPIQGDNFHFSQREIIHPYFLHLLHLKKKESADVYFSFNQEGQDLPVPLSMHTESSFFKTNLSLRTFHGFSLGINILFLLSTIILFSIFKNSYFLYFIFVTLFSIGYVFSEEGYGFMYLWSSSPFGQSCSRPLSIGLVTIFSLLFTMDFLAYKEHYKTVYKVSLIAISVYFASMILLHPIFLLPIYSEQLIGRFIFIFLIATLLLTVHNFNLCMYSYIKNRTNEALFIAGIYLTTILVLIFRMLTFQGLFPANFFSNHGGILALSIQTILISGFLIYRSVKAFRENQLIKVQMIEEKQRASAAIMQNIQNERERISMDIHDSLTSLVTAAKMNVESLGYKATQIQNEKEYSASLNLLSRIGKEMRTISHNLMPQTLKAFGIVEEMSKRISDLRDHSKLDIKYETFGFDNIRIPEAIELELYHISMELIDNAIKHAEAKSIFFQLNHFDKEINIIIEDDGKGFDIEHIRTGANGMVNIHNRVKLLNGVIDISSQINKGTSISINVPL